jgi:hypothetical protein
MRAARYCSPSAGRHSRLGTGQVCKWETLLAIDHLPLDQITNLPGRMRQFHEERLAAIAAENAAAADTLDDRLGRVCKACYGSIC